MKVTEVWGNNDPNWKEEELTELCKIVLRELKSSDDKKTGWCSRFVDSA